MCGMKHRSSEIRRTRPGDELSLAELFASLHAAGDDRSFHPHPMDADAAARIAAYTGRDIYAIGLVDGTAGVYGMLRGWDEGYDVPSLGIATHPRCRGLGLSRPMMEFLHLSARLAGAPRVRLKVYPDNQRAVALYTSLGYRFEGDDRGQLVGYWQPTPTENQP
jgi:ribosomal-protein-alanine N-acetyltransferase